MKLSISHNKIHEQHARMHGKHTRSTKILNIFPEKIRTNVITRILCSSIFINFFIFWLINFIRNCCFSLIEWNHQVKNRNILSVILHMVSPWYTCNINTLQPNLNVGSYQNFDLFHIGMANNNIRIGYILTSSLYTWRLITLLSMSSLIISLLFGLIAFLLPNKILTFLQSNFSIIVGLSIIGNLFIITFSHMMVTKSHIPREKTLIIYLALSIFNSFNYVNFLIVRSPELCSYRSIIQKQKIKSKDFILSNICGYVNRLQLLTSFLTVLLFEATIWGTKNRTMSGMFYSGYPGLFNNIMRITRIPDLSLNLNQNWNVLISFICIFSFLIYIYGLIHLSTNNKKII